jgi:hypothetical protein
MSSRLLAFVSLCLVSLFSFAQDLGTGTLTGNVVDPQGAVLHNAQVVAENLATGARRSTSTSASGTFFLNGLTPGGYLLQVTAQGFATSARKVQVTVGQQSDLRIPLKLQQAQTEITIDDTSAAVNVNTVSSVIDGVINSRQIEDLPLNGRNFLELALLLPGNTLAPNFDPTKANTVVISSAGQFGRGGSVTLDGADNNDDVVGGMLLNLPQDAVQEFQSATGRFSAELGRSGSAVMNVVTKSGSNQLHGSAAFFERDKALQGLPATFDRTLSTTPPFRRQQYAGSIGGPVVKSKAWWFGAFEYRDQLGGVLVGTRNLASQTITRSFAEAPLTDLLGTAKFDYQASNTNLLSFRYSLQRADSSNASKLDRPIGTASQLQDAKNNFQTFGTTWTHIFSPTVLNRFAFNENNFINTTNALGTGPQLTFPSLQDGSSFRVPQQTRQNRLQFSDNLDWSYGNHNLRFGGELQRIDADFNLGVFQQGMVQVVEDFPDFDRNNDGIVNDNDLLFAVGLRSAFPTRPLILPNADNNYFALYVQDDWHLHPQFTLNLGLRYELDTDVKNISGVSDLNPLILPFLHGSRGKDINNFGPRIGFNWANRAGSLSLHGGYGIYYDRVTLEIESLERGLDGRALPIEVHAGNVIANPATGIPIFLDPTGHFVPGAPTLANPFSGFIFPGAGAGGINVIDNNLQNPEVQQFNVGLQWEFARNWIVRADGLHTLGTHFIIGRPVGTVFNPVVGGPDVVKNIESSVNTHYDGLLLTLDKRAGRVEFHSAYTLSKSLNYANDDQIPFANGPIDPNNLHREYGATPNDQRHRFVVAATVSLPYGFQVSPLWSIASGVPMDILLPDASSRIPQLGRNAGGRQFHDAAELNTFITQLNSAGGVNGTPLPLVASNARFNDSFNSFDLRVQKTFRLGERASLQALAEVFNLFNMTNILGVSNTNYSGFANALVRDSNDPTNAGYLRSSSFGQAVSTAGGVFGSGGPRAFQFGARFQF